MIDDVISRLDKPRKTSRDSWLACCPAHDDHSPSLRIRLTDNGVVLLHCFAGCAVQDVLATIGLTFSSLYPSDGRSLGFIKGERRPWSAHDVLEALAFEVLLVWNHAKQMSAGQPVSDADQSRLLIAAQRLQAGLEMVNE